MVVEFKDYTAVIEAPLNEERSMAVLAEANRAGGFEPLTPFFHGLVFRPDVQIWVFRFGQPASKHGGMLPG